MEILSIKNNQLIVWNMLDIFSSLMLVCLYNLYQSILIYMYFLIYRTVMMFLLILEIKVCMPFFFTSVVIIIILYCISSLDGCKCKVKLQLAHAEIDIILRKCSSSSSLVILKNIYIKHMPKQSLT